MTNKTKLYTLITLVAFGVTGFLFSQFSPETTGSHPQNLNTDSMSNNIPTHLQRLFPDTDWSKVDPRMTEALSGGPSKDGIPALDNPDFIPLSESDYSDSMQVIVLIGDTETKVYPYGILTWHEIVNDTINDTPVAVTFCPLCGSAIVYDRTLPTGEVSTFGVSGSLLESNMIMYDRATENLWQQSTGEVLAGSHFPAKLELVPFQFMSIAEAHSTYSNAKVLSKDTGHNRNYDSNPYAGYETDNRFVFEPSSINTDFPAKTIMVVFRNNEDSVVTTPWLKLKEKGSIKKEISGNEYSFSITDSELTISDSNGNTQPFYFEMWFSLSVQHGDNLTVLEI